ncbi:MAG: sigma-70 family RNA polymerase sigma factor [Opitutales bacterium]|nr:sigma-70 family RNA polymerase sigma factor [Opitutales bacterium]
MAKQEQLPNAVNFAPESEEDWRVWMRANGHRMLLCARQWTKSMEDAEDVLQEAFVRYWKHQRHLGGNPDALILTSIRRAAIDLGRSRQRRAAREQAAFENADQVEWFEPKDFAKTALIESALKRLPEEQREVVVMKIWGSLKFSEIAEALSVSLSTVTSRYRYALTTLKKDLEGLE